jgi:hypothetical protein
MIDCEHEKLFSKKQPALERFYYTNGYHLEGTDFGPMGVKIELSHPCEGRQALILPPEKVRECALWLIRTLKQRKQSSTGKKPKII